MASVNTPSVPSLPDEQRRHVVAGHALHGALAGAHDAPAHQARLEPEHPVARDAVLEGARAARRSRRGCRRCSSSRASWGPARRRAPRARPRRGASPVITPGSTTAIEVGAVDLLDARQRVRRQHDARRRRARRRRCARCLPRAGVTGTSHASATSSAAATSARRRRDHHRVRRSPSDVAVVARVGRAGVGGGEHLGGTEAALELDLRAVDGRAPWNAYVGRLEEHATQFSAPDARAPPGAPGASGGSRRRSRDFARPAERWPILRDNGPTTAPSQAPRSVNHERR